ncbi:MAG: LPS-assembly protein LptD, partial [Candidatus Saccharicenans sp.]
EVLTAGLAQTIYFDPLHSPSKYYYPLNPERHFAPLNAYIRYYPQSGFSLDLSADFNPYEKNFLSSRLSLNLGRPEDNLYLSLNWSRNYQVISPESFFRSHQIGLQTGWRWPEKLDLKAQVEVDLQNRKLLYSALAGVYHYQCLDFSFDFRVFYYRIKPEAQFRFSVGLGNISRTTDLLGALGF